MILAGLKWAMLPLLVIILLSGVVIVAITWTHYPNGIGRRRKGWKNEKNRRHQ